MVYPPCKVNEEEIVVSQGTEKGKLFSTLIMEEEWKYPLKLCKYVKPVKTIIVKLQNTEKEKNFIAAREDR